MYLTKESEVFLMAMSNAEKQKAYRERKKAQGITDDRSRVFASVIYPESAPTDWRERLTQWHVAAVVSPLHDKDVNPDGAIKKPHHHVLLLFDGKKSVEQLKPLLDSIGAVGKENIISTRGYARYLCHLDNPEKAQYSTADVTCYGGAEYQVLINSPSDDLKALISVFEFVRKNQIRSLSHLIDYCIKYNTEWLMMITRDKAYIIDKYIKSAAWEIDTAQPRPIITNEDGEVIDV